MKETLIQALGGEAKEVGLFTRILAKEQALRLTVGMNKGIDLSSLKILMILPLMLLAFFNASLVHTYRGDAAMAATAVLFLYTLVLCGFNGVKILQGLLSDEDYRVVAAQPFRSNSFLLAQLAGPLRESLILYAAVCLPACVTAGFLLPGSVLDALILAMVAAVYAVALVILIGVGVTLAMRLVGLDHLRVGIFSAGLFLFMLAPVFLVNEGDAIRNLPHLTFAQVPLWLPIAWPAALMRPTTFPLQALAGLLVLIPLPILVFRHWAGSYTRLLGSARRRGTSVGGGWAYRLLTLGSKDPADMVMARLCLAHAREDWRFRGQMMLPPLIFLTLGLHQWMSAGSATLFADPFTVTDVIHPSMLLIALVVVPPMVALPMIAFSSHWQAGWILQQGVLPQSAFRAAFRRLSRNLCVWPYIGTLTLVYLSQDVALHHVAAHMFMLFMTAELLVIGVQGVFKGYPFTKPVGDPATANAFLPMMMCAEALGTLFAIFLYNVVYQWWWMYVAWCGFLVVIRRFMLLQQDNPAKPKPRQTPENVPEPETTPLIVAVKSQSYYTAKTLLAAGADPNAPGPDQKSAREWAEELGDPRICDLFRDHGVVSAG